MSQPVVLQGGHGLPYSKGLTAQALSASGLAPDRAFELAGELERRLVEDGVEAIEVADLRVRTERVLRDHEGEEAVRRYRDWQRLGSLSRPLIVLLGGAPGVGKSTLATRLAHRLGITRVIATDVIRQVLRAFFSPEQMATVHHSAFELDLEGFGEQARHVGRGAAAMVQRAAAEGTPLVLEGVHAVPGALDPGLRERCLVVEALLVVRDEELHRGHFSLRGADRPAERYRARFGEIRALQEHLAGLAGDAGVTVIDNENVDETLGLLMSLVLDSVAKVEARE